MAGWSVLFVDELRELLSVSMAGIMAAMLAALLEKYRVAVS
jgi:hypothetical protein